MSNETKEITEKTPKAKKEVVAPSVALFNALGEAFDTHVSKTDKIKYELGSNFIKIDFQASVPRIKSTYLKKTRIPSMEFRVDFMINEQDEALVIVKGVTHRGESELLRLIEADKKKWPTRSKETVAFIYEEVEARIKKYKNSVAMAVKNYFDELSDEEVVGSYTDLPEEFYHKLKGVSNSSAKYVEKTFNHYEFNKSNQQEPTHPQVLGQITHRKILEPKKFKKSVLVTDLDARKTEDAIQARVNNIIHSDKDIIKTKDLNCILAMENSFLEHPISKAIYKESRFEVTYFWMLNGVRCRGRVDGEIRNPSEELCELLAQCYPFSKEELMNSIIVWDVKTCMSAHGEDFARTVDDRDYHVQAGAYTDAIEKIAGKKVIYLIIALEKTAPYQVDVHAIDPVDVELGFKTFQERVEKIKFHQENPKAWKGYGLVKSGFLTRPRYAQNKDFDKFGDDSN